MTQPHTEPEYDSRKHERLDRCDLCGEPSRSARLVLVKNDLPVVRCRGCGVLYANPRLRQDLLWQRYAEDYFRNEYLPQHGAYDEQANYRFHAYHLGLLNRLAPQRGRLFEFGSAVGLFLAAARLDGWEVSGNELCGFAARYAHEHFGVEVLTGSAEELSLPPGSFDAVVLWETIEHVRSPQTVLRKAADLLRPGGILGISTPNLGGFSFGLLRERWWVVAPQEHIFLFTPRTLSRAVRQAGFRICAVHTIGTDFHYFWNTLRGRSRPSTFVLASQPPPPAAAPPVPARRPRGLWKRVEPHLIPALRDTVGGLKLADQLVLFARKV